MARHVRLYVQQEAVGDGRDMIWIMQRGVEKESQQIRFYTRCRCALWTEIDMIVLSQIDRLAIAHDWHHLKLARSGSARVISDHCPIVIFTYQNLNHPPACPTLETRAVLYSLLGSRSLVLSGGNHSLPPEGRAIKVSCHQRMREVYKRGSTFFFLRILPLLAAIEHCRCTA